MTATTKNEKLSELRTNVHPHCIVCDYANPKGLNIQYVSDDDNSVSASFLCEENYEGYPGIMHGGVISAILDGAMGNCMFAQGRATVTVEMTTKFRFPILIGKQASVSARITRISHPLYLLEAEIEQDGKVKATAKGKYYDQPQLAKVMEEKS